MSDMEKELFDLPSDLSDQSVHFSQLGSIHESSLSALRDQIKKVMIPLLIKTFQYQLDLIPTSRRDLKSEGIEDSCVKEAYEQLKTLDYDLNNLQLWCQSCRSQIHRALNLPDEGPKNIVATAQSTAHPGISKSFSDALMSQSCSEQSSSQTNFLGKSWWKLLRRKKTTY